MGRAIFNEIWINDLTKGVMIRRRKEREEEKVFIPSHTPFFNREKTIKVDCSQYFKLN